MFGSILGFWILKVFFEVIWNIFIKCGIYFIWKLFKKVICFCISLIVYEMYIVNRFFDFFYVVKIGLEE